MLPHNVAVIILSAGKGTRLKCTNMPKVMCRIGGKPIAAYIVETLESMGALPEQIIEVVGYQKDELKNYFGPRVTYADQDEQLGTAHAVSVGLGKVGLQIDTVLVIGGDDSAFYTEETLQNFMREHMNVHAPVSLLTVHRSDTDDVGRVIRDDRGGCIAILEKEQIQDEQKKITEISTGTYCFETKWFKDMFTRMPKIDGLGEYGLPKTIEMAIADGRSVNLVELENAHEWFGINTPDQLHTADMLKRNV